MGQKRSWRSVTTLALLFCGGVCVAAERYPVIYEHDVKVAMRDPSRAQGAGASAGHANDWLVAFPAHRVVDGVYYVGSAGLASYLITTPAEHILINSSLEASVPLIQASVEKLGFKFSDIKILLISHAHGDHCGAVRESRS